MQPVTTLFSLVFQCNWRLIFLSVQNLSMEVSGNDELLSQYLSYHFVHGNFLNSTAAGSGGGGGGMTSTLSQSGQSSSSSALASQTLLQRFRRQDGGGDPSAGQSMAPALMSGIYPNDTIGRTLLDSPDLVMLEGNKSQVLAWTKLNETGNVTLLDQACVHLYHLHFIILTIVLVGISSSRIPHPTRIYSSMRSMGLFNLQATCPRLFLRSMRRHS